MPAWKAGVNVGSHRQVITVSTDGTWFTNNGTKVNMSGNRALTLQALCKYAGMGENNSATFAEMIDHVWGDDEERESSFDTLKCNLLANIGCLRDAGLREAIRNHRGHGYYWSPEVILNFSGNKTPGEILERPLTILDRHKRMAEETADIQLRESKRSLSKSLSGKLGKADAPYLLSAFAHNGFTDADLARIFNISRPTAAKWRKKYE